MSNASFYKWRAKYGGVNASLISQMKATGKIMKVRHIAWAIVASISLANPAFAREPAQANKHVVPAPTRAMPNISGKLHVAEEVTYPLGGVSEPHRHAKSAFIYTCVVYGSIRSQLEGQPSRVYRASVSFFKEPGTHYLTGENTSQTQPAKLLAVFVVDAGDKKLTTPDKEGVIYDYSHRL